MEIVEATKNGIWTILDDENSTLYFMTNHEIDMLTNEKMTGALEPWMIERDVAEHALLNTAIPDYWEGIQEEAEQEIERILRA